MSEVAALDLVEQILVRLDVKDVMRCKSVCKSWRSLISTPRFAKAHFKHNNIKSDGDNHQLGHRRIYTYDSRNEETWICCNFYSIVGSCNGLVCVSPRDAKFLVTNPLTREEKKLQTLTNNMFKGEVRTVLCWGFGYDSSSDDYKVIAGLTTGLITGLTSTTRFHVLTLKSNTWKVIGEVKYQTLCGITGILCDGVLYWFMTDKDCEKKVIISLDLSTEELKEIPQPDDADYKTKIAFFKHRLGVIQDCLCISSLVSPKIWVMKNNKWELYIHDDCQQSTYDVAHCLSRVNDSQKTRGYVYSFSDSEGHYDGHRVPCNGDNIRSSVFVKSLLSPHPHADHKKVYEGVETGVKDKIRRKRNHRKQLKASG